MFVYIPTLYRELEDTVKKEWYYNLSGFCWTIKLNQQDDIKYVSLQGTSTLGSLCTVCLYINNKQNVTYDSEEGQSIILIRHLLDVCV